MFAGGRRRPRDVLHMAAMSAYRYNPQMKALYERLTDRGKHHKVAIVAVMRQLIAVSNSLLSDQREWTEDYGASIAPEGKMEARQAA